jgi:hypothetical protein
MTDPSWVLAAAEDIASETHCADVPKLAQLILRHCPPDVVGILEGPDAAPHLEVRLNFLPLASVRRPWVQASRDHRLWSHTGVLFQRPTVEPEDDVMPPKGYGFGLLQAYRDGRSLPLLEFDVELKRLGITAESIERIP